MEPLAKSYRVQGFLSSVGPRRDGLATYRSPSFKGKLLPRLCACLGSGRRWEVSNAPLRVFAASSNLPSKPESSRLPVHFGVAPFERIGQCLVFSPPGPTPAPAVVNFVGGSFIGAAPDLFYSYFLKLLVDEGFLVIATLYDVSWDHTSTAASVQSRFTESWQILNERGLTSANLKPGEISRLPIFGVGHSLGALMLALIGIQEDLTSSPAAPSGNVIISYTNRAVSDASNAGANPSLLLGGANHQSIPSQLSLLSSVSLLGTSLMEQSLEFFQRSHMPLSDVLTRETLDPFLRFSGSFSPVLNDSLNGVWTYYPSPMQNLEAIASRYSVPSSLVLQCVEDDWEDSPALEGALRQRARSAESEGVSLSVERMVLPGTHFTPAAPEVLWQVGEMFTPVDALAVAAKASYLTDIRGMAKVTSDWIRSVRH